MAEGLLTLWAFWLQIKVLMVFLIKDAKSEPIPFSQVFKVLFGL